MTGLAKCTSPECRATIDATNAFCPVCGADNRPPDKQTPVEYCDHNFYYGPYCVGCGVEKGSGLAETRKIGEARRRGRFLIVAGTAAWAIALAAYIGSVVADPGGTLSSRINAPIGADIAVHPLRPAFNYSQEPRVRVPWYQRREGSDNYESNTWPPTVAEVFVVGCFGFGLVALFGGALTVSRKREKEVKRWKDPTEPSNDRDRLFW